MEKLDIEKICIYDLIENDFIVEMVKQTQFYNKYVLFSKDYKLLIGAIYSEKDSIIAISYKINVYTLKNKETFKAVDILNKYC